MTKWVNEWKLGIVFTLVAGALSVVVVMWDNTIETLKEYEHRITKLEQQVKVLTKEKAE